MYFLVNVNKCNEIYYNIILNKMYGSNVFALFAFLYIKYIKLLYVQDINLKLFKIKTECLNSINIFLPT